MVKTAIYTRVSTSNQVENYSLPQQKERLEAYCKANDYEIYDYYEDAGRSGKDLNREEMQRLIEDAKNHRFNMVLVLKLDRLSRSQRDVLYLIEDVFEPNGVEFRSATEPFQTDTPMGKFAISMLSVFAQIERTTIRDRLYSGRIEMVKDGYFRGGGNIPIGYSYTKGDKILKVNEAEAEIVRLIFELYASGKSQTFIKNELHRLGYIGEGRVTRTTVIKRILQNPTYIGKVRFDGEVYDGRHEPIISEELFEKVQKRLNEVEDLKYHGGNPFKARHLLTSILKCPCCGGGWTITHNGNGRTYYKCYSRLGHIEKRKSENCLSKGVREDYLDQLVIDEILKLKWEDVSKQKRENRIPKIKAELNKLEKKRVRLVDLYLSSNIDLSVLDEKAKELDIQIENLRNQIEIQRSNLANNDVFRSNLENAREILENGDMDTKRALVQALIEKIELTNKDDITIYWRI